MNRKSSVDVIEKKREAFSLVAEPFSPPLPVQETDAGRHAAGLRLQDAAADEDPTMSVPREKAHNAPSTAPEALDRMLRRLAESAFRRRFALDDADRAALERTGMDVMRRHAREILLKRLAPAVIANDGHQTPMRGYPVFKAQHATALCCRQCMQKWHAIPAGRALSAEELDYAVALIMRWIEAALKRPASGKSRAPADGKNARRRKLPTSPDEDRQQSLF